MNADAAMLRTAGLAKSFGGLQVIRDVDFALPRGARHALIGPNGAGKTTFINLLTGALRPSAGSVHLDGADITGLAEQQRVRRGLARTFQINQLFGALTVFDNVALAVGHRLGVAGSLFRRAAAHDELIDGVMGILAQLGLAADAFRPVRELPYGSQRLVEIAIALGLKPKILLMDEPAAGVPTDRREMLLAIIAALPAEMSILMIEHDMEMVFRFAAQVTVLVAGQVLVTGPAAQIAADARVREVYLGSASHG